MISKLLIRNAGRTALNKRRFLIAVSMLTALSLLIAGCAGAGGLAPDPTVPPTAQTDLKTADTVSAAPVTESYTMSIDVNPSIQLTVVEGLVTTCAAFNDEAELIILAASVIGLTPEAAVEAIIAELAQGGYLGDEELDPQLIVTVSNDGQVSEETIESLKDSAEQALEAQGADCKVNTAYVSAAFAQEAADADLTVGRYMLYKAIAKSQEMTLDAVIEEYGNLKIGELLGMFEDAKAIFKEYNKTAELDEDLEGLTPEQLEIIGPALDAFHAEMKAANNAFHQAFAVIKQETRQSLTELKVQYRHQDKDGYKEQADSIRQNMLAQRRAAIVAMKAAIRTAKQNFYAAVAAMDLPEDVLARFIEQEADEMAEDEPDELEGLLDNLAQEPEDDDEEEDEDEDEDKNGDEDDEDGEGKPFEKVNQGKANGKDAKQTDIEDDEEDDEQVNE